MRPDEAEVDRAGDRHQDGRSEHRSRHPSRGRANAKRKQGKGQREQTCEETYRVIRRNVEHATIVAAALKKRVREEGPLQTRRRPRWIRSRGSARHAGQQSSGRWKGRVLSASPRATDPPGRNVQ